MASEWRQACLEDLIEVKHGFAFQGQFFHDDPPGDVLLTPGNFAIGGGFKGDKLKYYRGPTPEEFVLGEGDLLITMTDLSKRADTLGFPALVPRSTGTARYLHNQRLGKVLIRPGAPVESSRQESI
jgi:type I restriction enzyme S subunit